MRSVWMTAAFLLILTVGCAKSAREPVGCTIGGAPICKLGDAPEITVKLTNQTEADIYLVGSLDASDRRKRYPYCYFEITGPDGKPADHGGGGGGGCGNKNALRPKDFVKVSPGEAFDPYQSNDDHGFFPSHQLSSHNFQKPGAYRIRFVYSSRSDDIGKWDGDLGWKATARTEMERMFRRVPKVVVRSDEFALTVVAPGK